MFINIGNDNYVESTRILSVTIVGSSPIRKAMQNAGEKGQLIDLTCGKKTRSLVIMDTGVIFQSSIAPNTIAERSNYYKKNSNNDNNNNIKNNSNIEKKPKYKKNKNKRNNKRNNNNSNRKNNNGKRYFYYDDKTKRR